MSEKYGNCSKSLVDIARGMTLVMIGVQSLESTFDGGLYLSREDWDSIYFVFAANRGDANKELRAVKSALSQYLSPNKAISHLFIDRLYCPECKNNPCKKHTEENYKPPRYGMKLSQLTPELMDEILDLYGKICEIPQDNIFWRRKQNGWTGEYHIEGIKRSFDMTNCAEWRYGSGLPSIPGRQHGSYDTDGKFFVWKEDYVYENNERVDTVLRFSFDPNIIESDQAWKMREDFRVAVEDLLEVKGLAVPIKS